MKRIIVIDDSAVVLNVVKFALEEAGYAVTSMDNPLHFDFITHEAPDLILVDIKMPQCAGDDLVSYLKRENPAPTPIYLFSDIAESELKERARRCHADGYICKDWGLESLVAKVKETLGDR